MAEVAYRVRSRVADCGGGVRRGSVLDAER
jgi:hypothetical protein